MNVRGLANRATRVVNPNTSAQWRKYLSYTTLPNGTVGKSYASPVPLIAQVQALSRREVEHIQSLNISPCDRAAYVNGQLSAFNRISKTGGDMLFFENTWWLVMAILEGWTTAGWCKVALIEQKDAP